jgi:hypothetical protein
MKRERGMLDLITKLSEVIANVFPVNFELFLKISNIFDD